MDIGQFPPLIDAQRGLNILIEHFLGDDWYCTLSMHTDQVNTEAIYEILQKYPKKISMIEKIKNKVRI